MKKVIGYIPLIIIVLFLALFFSYQNGYYDKYMKDKISLTNEAIEKFESDIKNGSDVTIEDYLPNEKNYSTKASNFSLKVSNKFENIVSKGVKFIFKKISSVVE